MSSRRAWTDRLVTVAVIAAGAVLAAHLVWYVGDWGSETLRAYVTDGIYPPLALLFTALAGRAARRAGRTARSGGPDRRTRLAWSVITAAFACQLVAHSSWFVEDAILHQTDYPSFADYWFLAFVPVMVVALFLLPGPRRSRSDLVRLGLDALIVGAGTFMVLWYLVLGPIFDTPGTSLSEIVYSAALPVGDLLLVLALTSVLLRSDGHGGPSVRLLGAGVAVYVVADVYYGYIQLHDGFIGGTWPDLCWLLGCYLFALAAQRQHRQIGRLAAAPGIRRGRINLTPYAAIMPAYGLLAVLGFRQGVYPFGGMIVGAVLLTALVVARQMTALRDNRDLAVTDALTGLANRNLVAERLSRLAQLPVRDGRHSAVLLIDLDRFKPINDAYGHDAGDAVLRAVATAMRAVIRSGDTAGRLGGDEFAVVLQNLPTPAAAAAAGERLLEALRTPVIVGDQPLAVEASIGVAVRDDPAVTGEMLLRQADAAMYAAKRSGRSRMRIYTAELDSRARDAELRAGIEAGELTVHYQPAVDLADERIVAVEALVRWNHPVRGLLMPAEFIDLAEETGTIVPLGEWVLRAACRAAASWAHPDLRLSVNMSPKQVVRADLVEVIQGILRDTGFPADRLILELTESVILQPDPMIVARLERLRDMGIGIAVDDFGTGFSALSYLRHLPVNVLKVDRSFVTGIADDPQARTVADAIIRLGEAFRLVVVAEGIETAEQAAALQEMGCRFGQGFRYHRPQPGESITRLLGRTFVP